MWQALPYEVSMTGKAMARTAIWTAIADQLTGEIGSGQRLPGEKLPSEAELAARYGVNRHTVRRALAALAEQGLVHARRGAGVFVQTRPLDYPIGRRTRLSKNLAAIGREAGRRILSLDTRHAGPAEAEALGLHDGAMVHVMEGISSADGVPFAVVRSVFPAARFPDLLAALRENTSITAALADQGLADYVRRETRLNAKLATASIALHLRIRQGDPILRTISVNVDADGTPVEYGHTWMSGQQVTLTVSAEDTGS